MSQVVESCRHSLRSLSRLATSSQPRSLSTERALHKPQKSISPFRNIQPFPAQRIVTRSYTSVAPSPYEDPNDANATPASPTPSPSETSSQASASQNQTKPWIVDPHRNPDEPVYQLYATCKVCKKRSAKTISKQGYHRGTVLLQCDGCGNKHLITDHLKIFSEQGQSFEQILKNKGQVLKYGGLDSRGNIEMWDQKAAKEMEKVTDAISEAKQKAQREGQES
ncbi:MAG: hypothetical protein M1831_001177 [Alyxoria varia]|nr:MAG: hypothetical protein M1831_001177 [Alyxoria varia]